MPHNRLACRAGFLASCVLLAAVVGVVYAPSLHHEPRADQWAYFMETVGHDRFLDLLAHTYSYNRTTHMFSGDTQLFRPLFFALMAFQKAFFGTRFMLCQATGIVLHVIACWLLYAFLRRVITTGTATMETTRSAVIRSPLTYLPLALTLFFALNFAIVEQVIWYNINGYLLALVLLLGSLNLVARAELTPDRSGRWLLTGAWLLGLLASFAYELGQIYALCAAFGLAANRLARGQRWRALFTSMAFLLIIACYQSANLLDRYAHRGDFRDDVSLQKIASRAGHVETLYRAARYAVFTEVQPFFPFNCGMEMLAYGKLHVGEQVWAGVMPMTPWLWVSSVVLGLWIGLVLLGGGRLLGGVRGGPLGLGLIGLGTALGHIALIVIGRMNLRPWPEQLAVNPYYTYTTLLFSICGGAVCLAWALRPRVDYRCAVTQGLTWLFVLGLVVLSVGGGRKVHRLNTKVERSEVAFHAWNDSLRTFVEEHRKEPGFRFAVIPEAITSMPHSHGVPAPWIFFGRYIDPTHPTYLLSFADGRFLGVAVADWLAEHGRLPGRFPELLQIGPEFHIFEANGRFHVVCRKYTKAYLMSLGDPSWATFRDTSLCRARARMDAWLVRE